MEKSKIVPGHHCCSIEKKHLDKDLFCCDYSSTSYEEHHACYRHASKLSSRRGRACMYS